MIEKKCNNIQMIGYCVLNRNGWRALTLMRIEGEKEDTQVIRGQVTEAL